MRVSVFDGARRCLCLCGASAMASFFALPQSQFQRPFSTRRRVVTNVLFLFATWETLEGETPQFVLVMCSAFLKKWLLTNFKLQMHQNIKQQLVLNMNPGGLEAGNSKCHAAVPPSRPPSHVPPPHVPMHIVVDR